MVTKKQLAALAYGRAVRKANLRKGTKRCRTNKKKKNKLLKMKKK